MRLELKKTRDFVNTFSRVHAQPHIQHLSCRNVTITTH